MAQMAMAPCPIVEDFDVIEDVGTGQVAGFVDALANAFLFQAAEEGLSHGIVPAVAAPTHARLQTVRLAEALPIIAAVLTALVGVHQHRLGRLATPNGHQQRIQGQFA